MKWPRGLKDLKESEQVAPWTKRTTSKGKKKYEEKGKTLCEMIENARINEQPSTKGENHKTTQGVILEAMLDVADRELKILEEKSY